VYALISLNIMVGYRKEAMMATKEDERPAKHA